MVFTLAQVLALAGIMTAIMCWQAFKIGRQEKELKEIRRNPQQ